ELDPGSLCSRTFIAAMALYVDLCDCNVFNGLRTGAQCFLAAPREEGATCRCQCAHAKRLDCRTIDGTGVERHPYRRYWSSKCALCERWYLFCRGLDDDSCENSTQRACRPSAARMAPSRQ